jgi:hypothetical protein
MTTSAAGWYPDPAGSGGLRWWDGFTWSDQVQPAVQPSAAPAQAWDGGQQWGVGAPEPQQWTGQQTHPAPAGFAKQNTNSLIVAALVVICVVLAATTGYVVFALVPVFFGIRAVQAKEPLAWPAIGVAAALLIWRFLV